MQHHCMIVEKFILTVCFFKESCISYNTELLAIRKKNPQWKTRGLLVAGDWPEDKSSDPHRTIQIIKKMAAKKSQ